jgi:methylisocitrate lyase
MTEFGKTPYLTVAQFAALGYRMVIFPMTAFRAMMKAVEQTFLQLRDQGTQQHFLDQLQTRQELYDLLQYTQYTQFDAALAARFPE